MILIYVLHCIFQQISPSLNGREVKTQKMLSLLITLNEVYIFKLDFIRPCHTWRCTAFHDVADMMGV